MINLPPRAGPRPETQPCAPHSQLSQCLPPGERRPLTEALVEGLGTLDHVRLGWSMRAPPGTVGFFLDSSQAAADERAFLLGHEFAHVHGEDDGSLHAILPEPLRSEAIAKGWAEPHPLAGRPTVSPDTVMIYAPRDAGEVALILALLRQSRRNALRDPER
ncbi:DUF5519 family protein [Sphingomonas sp. AOB5]|uniref:luciferase domain-containing protein n=1 Tax=Sphingomonas sp. AOB5 TaxID=3034017 RepID=UPI0023F9BDE5|nr:luciferase family protein [Sphingomonas sp. AOB5]MDF7777210.1 DUF5519 family protein [Sphingomonas sp. AOB5]